MDLNTTTRSAHEETEEQLFAAEALTALCGRTSNTPSPPLAPSKFPILLMPTLPSNLRTTAPSQAKTSWGWKQESKTEVKPDKVKKNFPEKLYAILEKPENSDILKWLPGGKAFIVMDKKRFASEILPAYLKQSQFTSFTRKLCRWKFVRVPRGPFMGAYYHKLFRRDHPTLCNLMSCNNDVPSLALIAQARQQATHSISTECTQLNDLKSVEEANRVSAIQGQLLNIRLNRARHHEQQKRILRYAEASRVVPCPQTRQRPLPNQSPSSQQLQRFHHEFYSNGNSSSNSSRVVIQDAFRALKRGSVMEYNARMSQLAELRQTGMLHSASNARTNYMMRTMQQNQASKGQNRGQDQGALRNSTCPASAAY